MEERLAGKRLVQMVELGRKECGGVEEGMKEWAFDKLEEGKEEEEWDCSVRGCAEKPWKRGQGFVLDWPRSVSSGLELRERDAPTGGR